MTDLAALHQAALPKLMDRLARGLAPRGRLTVSDWADRHRWVSSKQSGISGNWRTDRNPMLREIMDCFSAHSPVREIWVMKSSQVGITESMVNAIGYRIDYAPCPMMVLMPTLELRDKWKLQKLNPILQDQGRVRDILGGLRSRDAANSKDAIDFPGGILFLAGGNSPNSYAQASAQIVLCDDYDRFPQEVGDEGGADLLVRGRVKAFPHSYKLGFFSTPTLKGASLIEAGYDRTDRRRYHVACPACGERQPLVWPNMRWDTTNTHPAWAEYECAHCGHGIRETHKPVLLAEGGWVPQNHDAPDTLRGYHITALLAPVGLGPSWLDLATLFKRVAKEPNDLKVFINTNLGETWEDRSNKLETNVLVRRMEDYAFRSLPEGCVAVTAGIDTQDAWLAISLIGHGAPLAPDLPPRVWLLDYHEIRVPQRDTTCVEPWDDLDDYLHLPIARADGAAVRISAACIDSRGHRAEQVRAFVQRQALSVPVYAVQGSTTRLGRFIAQKPTDPDRSRNKTSRHAYGIWNVGTEIIKHYIYGHLHADGERGQAERVFHFPAGLPIDYFDGLLSEVFDPEKNRFVQKLGARHKRNEPLDTLVYALAAAHHPHILVGLRRSRDGYLPDPGYWIRQAAKLQALAADPGAAFHGVVAQAPTPAATNSGAPKPAATVPRSALAALIAGRG